jgi:hypothetical protein
MRIALPRRRGGRSAQIQVQADQLGEALLLVVPAGAVHVAQRRHPLVRYQYAANALHAPAAKLDRYTSGSSVTPRRLPDRLDVGCHPSASRGPSDVLQLPRPRRRAADRIRPAEKKHIDPVGGGDPKRANEWTCGRSPRVTLVACREEGQVITTSDSSRQAIAVLVIQFQTRKASSRVN